MTLAQRLLDPDTDNQGGGDTSAADNQSSLDGNLSDDSSQQPTQVTEEPSGPSADQIANWERIEQEHKTLSGFAETLRQNNVTTPDALNEQLVLINQINSNEQIKATVNALLTPTSQPGDTDASRGTSFGAEDVEKLVQEKLTQYHEAEANKQRTANETVENELLNQVLGDDSLKPFIDGKSTTDLWANKGSKVGRAISIIADDLLGQRGQIDPTTGRLMPVTDRTSVDAVKAELTGILKEIRLQNIMDLSTDAKSIESPDTPAAQESGDGQLDAELDSPLWNSTEKQKNNDAIARTFKNAHRKASATGSGGPLSQG